MGRQFQLPQPHPPIGGLVSGYIFPQAQPRQEREARQTGEQGWTRFTWAGTEAAATTQTYTFPPAVLPPRRTFAVVSKNTSVTGTPKSVTLNDPQFVLGQPSADYWTPPRWQFDLKPRLDAQVITTFTAFDGSQTIPVLPPPRIRQTPSDVTLPIGGAAAAASAADVFTLFTNPIGYDQRPAPKITFRQIRGIAVPVQNPTAILDQPTSRWWIPIEQRARMFIPQPRTDQGAVLRPSYVFPLDQPDRRAWYVPRAQPGPILRLDGAIQIGSFVFVLSQPDRAGYYATRLDVPVAKQLTGVFTPPPAAQTYIFEPGQPSRRFWYIPRLTTEQQKLYQALETKTTNVPILHRADQADAQRWPMPVVQMPGPTLAAVDPSIRLFLAAWATGSNRYLSFTVDVPTGDSDD